MKRAVFVPKTQLDETLKTPAIQGKHGIEPLLSFAKKNRLPFHVLEDSEVVNDAEIHKTEGDLWMCLEGEATFVCDGELKDTWLGKRADGTENPNELKAKALAGGVEYVLKPGDWLWIPAGVAHQHSAAGTARLIIIKIPR